MKREPVLLVDCDGVLADLVGAFLREVHSITGKTFTREEILHYQIFHPTRGVNVPEVPGLERIVWERAKDRGFCTALEPYDHGARSYFADLRRVGVRVLAVTAPLASPYWVHERTEWLYEHFGFKQREIIFAHAKDLVRGSVLVDDHVSHVDAWQNANPHPERAVLWSQPYNRHADATAYPWRASTWGDVDDHLRAAR